MMEQVQIAPVHIRKSVAVSVGAIVVAGGFATTLGGLLLIAAFRGRISEMPFMTVLFFVVSAGMAAWGLRDLMDRSVQVTLTAAGFRDHRTGGELTPWSIVRKAHHYGGAGTRSACAEFEVDDGSTRVVRIMTDGLDAWPSSILDYVRRAAPHVVIK